MEKIVIKDLRFEVSIGVHVHEKIRRQIVTIDLEIGLPADCTQHDDLQHTIDYEQVALRIESLATSRHYGLVETMVDRIATMLTEEFGALWAHVAAGKVGIISNAGYVGVCIERRSPGREEALERAASALADSSRGRGGCTTTGPPIVCDTRGLPE